MIFQLIPVINVTVLLLLCLMAALAYSKIATIHILIMSTLAVGLLVSVNWLFSLLLHNYYNVAYN